MHRLDGSFSANLALAAQVSSTVVVFGERQHDHFLSAGDEGVHIAAGLGEFLSTAVGCRAVWQFDPTRGKIVLHHGEAPAGVNTVLPTRIGDEKTIRLERIIEALAGLEVDCACEQAAAWQYAVLVNAEFLFETAAATGPDLGLLRTIAQFAQDRPGARGLLFRVRHLGDLPARLTTMRAVKSIGIPVANQDVRLAYAQERVAQLASIPPAQHLQLARTVTWVTDDWLLCELDQLFELIARRRIADFRQVEALARALVSGVASSPWNGEELARVVAGARAALEHRIKGQPAAIDAVLASLEQSVVGISSAQHGHDVHRPRAIFFFAGPTGVGKTEMAKAVSQLVFGQERLLRFDCGELQEQHSIARLIGAPPGYVGHDQGGELTEGIRRNPNSIVLFDEVEKAHPRVFDLLLGMLDDGRLTSGRGESVYFDESIIVFTTNLGTAALAEEGAADGSHRALYDIDFARLQQVMRETIRREFTQRLRRPELLGRLGGESGIIVFDYLRDIGGTLGKFLGNVKEGLAERLDITLSVAPEVLERLVAEIGSDDELLRLGGRGVRQALDRRVTLELASFIFRNHVRECRLEVAMGADAKIVVRRI